jgi:hypothetical protein
MNNIFKILSVFAIFVGIAACTSTPTVEPETPRDYATQYATDLAAIDSYINTHYLTFDADYNVTFDTLLPSSGHSSIRTDTAFQLKDTTVIEDGIDYKVYFIKFREGTEKRPTQVDSIHIAYKGIKLLKSAPFDQAVTPIWFRLQEVITGWSHIIPNFKTGTYTPGTGGNPTIFNNYGAGVMFLPSGLAYYNNSAGTIPSYSPLIFSFKLHELRYRDHDTDGVLSKDERKLDPSVSALIRWKENPGGNLLKKDNTGAVVTDVAFFDSDSDGVPNMFDIDDDGDRVMTRVEIKNPSGGLYLYNLIPDCSGSTTNPNRVRKHINPACQ